MHFKSFDRDCDNALKEERPLGDILKQLKVVLKDVECELFLTWKSDVFCRYFGNCGIRNEC